MAGLSGEGQQSDHIAPEILPSVRIAAEGYVVVIVLQIDLAARGAAVSEPRAIKGPSSP